MPCPSQYADWIEELADEGITAGCGSGNFCPTQVLGSWQMLAWAQKVWPGYCPLPRTSVLTYRDEGARVITEANQLTSGDDTSETITYPRDNVFLGSQLVSSAVWTGTTPSYQFFAVDHLGSTRLATDVAGLIVESYKYWPYGDDGPGTGTANQRLTFAGMERDTENKHYFDHARTQDFNIGRFLALDPVSGWRGSPQSWNRYSYVQGNPMSLVDPTGLLTSVITICVTTTTWSGATASIDVHCTNSVYTDPDVASSGSDITDTHGVPLVPRYLLPHSPQQSFFGCVQERAESASVRQAFSLGDSFAARAFGDNTPATLIGVFRTFSGGDGSDNVFRDMGGEVVSEGVPRVANRIARSIPNLSYASVTARLTAARNAGSSAFSLNISSFSAELPIGSAAISAAATAEALGQAKLGYDVAVAIAAAGSCARSR